MPRGGALEKPLSGKEHACQWRRCRFSPWVRKILWRRKWQSTPVFLPGKSHGQRSPWVRKRVRHAPAAFSFALRDFAMSPSSLPGSELLENKHGGLFAAPATPPPGISGSGAGPWWLLPASLTGEHRFLECL